MLEPTDRLMVCQLAINNYVEGYGDRGLVPSLNGPRKYTKNIGNSMEFGLHVLLNHNEVVNSKAVSPYEFQTISWKTEFTSSAAKVC